MELIKPTQHIPNDIVKILLQFDGRIKYRNGRYIDIIAYDDERYAMLDKVVKKKLEVYRDSNKDRPLLFNYFVHYIYFNKFPYIGIKYVYYVNRFGESQINFIFSKNNETNILMNIVARFTFT